MRKTSFVLMIALVIASCKTEPEYTELQRNIVSNLAAKRPGIESSFFFTDYEILDTIMTGEAIDRCIDLHRVKAEVSKANADKFRRIPKRRNAARYDSVAAYSGDIVLELTALKSGLGKDCYRPLYYCVRFSGRTYGLQPEFVVNNCFITIGTDGKIHNMQNSANGLHTGMGSLIPQYLDILESEKIK